MDHGQLGIEAQRVDGAIRLAISGELDLSTTEDLRSVLEEHRGGGRQVLIDLSELEFMDSTGLHVLLDAQSDARRDGWNLAFSPEVRPGVERLLELTNARRLFEWETRPSG